MSDYIEREVALHGLDANISHLRKVADGNPLLNKAVNLVQYTRDFIATLPAADVVSRAVFDQVMWERDVAIQQLREDYGVSLGEKKPADVVERKHGHIIETVKDGKMNRVFSCCGEDFTKLTSWMTPNFCPNCGADMRGE